MKTYTDGVIRYKDICGRKRRCDLHFVPRKFSRCLKNWDSEMEANTRRKRNTTENIRVCVTTICDLIGSHYISFRFSRKIATMEIVGKLQGLAKLFLPQINSSLPPTFLCSFFQSKKKFPATIKIFPFVHLSGQTFSIFPRNIYRFLSRHF